MGPFLASIHVIGGPIPIIVTIAAIAAAIVLAVRVRPAGARRRWMLLVIAALVGGAAAGLLTCWIVGDLLNAFDVTLTIAPRLWVAGAFAGTALAVLTLVKSSPRRRTMAGVSIVVFALMGAIGVNADFGQYPTLASVLGVSSIDTLPGSIRDSQAAAASQHPANPEPALWSVWKPPADLPKHGLVRAVTIPATTSHFSARQALIYLPPAALVANPPKLPVLVMLSGQPGRPEHIFIAGHLDKLMDAMAAKHGGLAPIVVVPDQLGAPDNNPMCVDGPLGNSATYLTVDVPAWIHANLNVQQSRTSWGIGGFSQGGTCAIQLGAGYPSLFGSIIDVSGELVPKIGTPEVTIAKGFSGNATAYAAAMPLALIAKNAPFTDTFALFAAGALDAKYSPRIATVSAAAKLAGMTTTVLSSPGTSHDWYTVQYAFRVGLPLLYARMGLSRPTS